MSNSNPNSTSNPQQNLSANEQKQKALEFFDDIIRAVDSRMQVEGYSRNARNGYTRMPQHHYANHDILGDSNKEAKARLSGDQAGGEDGTKDGSQGDGMSGQERTGGSEIGSRDTKGASLRRRMLAKWK